MSSTPRSAADHGVNIAQNVTYVVTGAFPEEDPVITDG
jgi:phosphate uptake regulator